MNFKKHNSGDSIPGGLYLCWVKRPGLEPMVTVLEFYEKIDDVPAGWMQSKAYDVPDSCVISYAKIPPLGADVCTNIVAGKVLNISGTDFLQRAKILIEIEQAKIAPENHLINFICDAVRLWREHEDMATKRANNISDVE